MASAEQKQEDDKQPQERKKRKESTANSSEGIKVKAKQSQKKLLPAVSAVRFARDAAHIKCAVEANNSLWTAMIDVTKTREKSKAPNIQQSAISFAQTSAAIALCKNAITLDTYEDLLGGIVGIGPACLAAVYASFSDAPDSVTVSERPHDSEVQSQEPKKTKQKRLRTMGGPRGLVAASDSGISEEPGKSDQSDQENSDESRDWTSGNSTVNVDSQASKTMARLFFNHPRGFVLTELKGADKKIGEQTSIMRKLINLGYVTDPGRKKNVTRFVTAHGKATWESYKGLENVLEKPNQSSEVDREVVEISSSDDDLAGKGPSAPKREILDEQKRENDKPCGGTSLRHQSSDSAKRCRICDQKVALADFIKCSTCYGLVCNLCCVRLPAQYKCGTCHTNARY